MHDGHERVVQTLVRFFIYTTMLFGLLVGIPYLLKPGDILMFNEDNPIENIQVLILVSTAAVFGFGAWLERPMRELFTLLCLVSAFAAIRELDGFFDKMPFIRWEMPDAVIVVAGVWLGLRSRQILISQTESFISSVPFGVLWAGIVVVVIIAQLIGHGRFLEMALGDDYRRDYKRVIEETCELCGYFILFFGALEAVLFDGKFRRNGQRNRNKPLENPKIRD